MQEQRTAANELQQYLENQVRRHRGSLAHSARSLARDLTRLAELAESDREYVSVNELGEIQSRGTMLDARCASLSEAQETLKAARLWFAPGKTEDDA
jgi:hypothetical protein